MEKYPDGETYQKLYQRFYNGRSSRELIEFAGPIEGRSVLDLCGGDGRLSLEAIKLGARAVWLVDQEEKMISGDSWRNPKVNIVVNKVELALKEFIRTRDLFDHIFCQQAVNYWLNEKTAELTAKVLRKDGVFAFNTFSRKPPAIPMIKKYEIDGKKFLEVSWLVGDLVHHVQEREGLPCHITSFRWLSPEYLSEILRPYFSVTIKKEGNASLYRCTRK